MGGSTTQNEVRTQGAHGRGGQQCQWPQCGSGSNYTWDEMKRAGCVVTFVRTFERGVGARQRQLC